MYPLIPPELIQSAAQMVVSWITVAAVLISFMLSART